MEIVVCKDYMERGKIKVLGQIRLSLKTTSGRSQLTEALTQSIKHLGFHGLIAHCTTSVNRGID